jgi:hypothetical protein
VKLAPEQVHVRTCALLACQPQRHHHPPPNVLRPTNTHRRWTACIGRS